MVFSSFQFLFAYLPVVVFVYILLQKFHLDKFKPLWLLICSLSFYLFWDPYDLIPLLVSASINYVFYKLILYNPKKMYLILGILFNIFFLGWYKYTWVFLMSPLPIEIPLGISFYTFTQIAFLVDVFDQKPQGIRYIKYNLFVSYFPHLMCGPILLFRNFYPQISQGHIARINLNNIVFFLFFFSIGLFKKTFIADPLGAYVSSIFSVQPSLVDYKYLMLGVLSYAFQIYADFSGYSDMAIGLSRLFGITIPFNFNSPYKSTSIIGFWNSWHISLSSFLKHYLYIPLGGNQRRKIRQYGNLLVVMILGGIWHGSTLTFLIWGFYQGILLVLNHAIRHAFHNHKRRFISLERLSILKNGVVFILICIGWVFFRSTTLSQALEILKSLFLLKTSSLMIGFTSKFQYISLVLGIVISFFLPETHTLYESLEKNSSSSLRVQKILPFLAAMVGFIAFLGVCSINKPQQFLYSGF